MEALQSLSSTLDAEIQQAVQALPETLSALETARRDRFSEEGAAAMAAAAAQPESGEAAQNVWMVETLEGVRVSAVNALQTAETVMSFLQLQVPQVEDGGNFGVHIIEASHEQIAKRRSALATAVEKLSDYFKDRADAWDKVARSASTEEKRKETTTDGETKVETTTETSNKAATPSPDAQSAVYAVDLKYYSALRAALADTRAILIVALGLFLKNEDKIRNPRGGSSHSSMF